ncbi:GDSL esterase/lipase At5g55050-like [Castanea sativa]|uniref:GDSL esterase/lipase At5g55050-like n=1 Tax=Castanea sativa TaxID=21020 RepID=UPI003F652A53
MECKVLLLTFFIITSFNLSKAQMVPAMFLFGDSLVDVGNNNYLKLSIAKADLPYYGIDLPNQKANGRFTNGMNAADFLAEKLGLPTAPPYLSLVDESNENNNVSFLNGVNFASGGARIWGGKNHPLSQSIHLTQQLDYFSIVYKDLYKQLGSSGAKNHLSKSIFTFVIGSNDIFRYFESSDLQNKTTSLQYVDSMVLSIKAILKRLYGFGARKFVIAGIGSIGCCPARRRVTKNEECHEEINFWSDKYNKGLISMLQELKSVLKGINYSYFDTYKALFDLVQRPAAYGFVEVKAACCGLGTLNAEIFCLPIAEYCSNRSDYVFFDKVHPTEAAHRILVDRMFDGSLQYAFPMNVKQLIAI